MKSQRTFFSAWPRFWLGLAVTLLLAAGGYVWLRPSPSLGVDAARDIAFYSLPFGANPFAPGEIKTPDGKLVNWRGVARSTTCAECHPREFKEWNTSIHSISDRDLIYDSTVQENTTASRAGAAHGAEKGRWCESCHNPLGTLTGLVTPTPSAPEQEALEEGVSCVVCHTATHADPKAGNGALVSNINGILRHAAPAEIMAAPSRHARDMNAARHSELIGSSDLCGACHVEKGSASVNGRAPMLFQSTWEEWRRSDYAKKGVQCQSCHMAQDPAGYIAALQRGETPKKQVSHRIAGNNYLLADPSLPGGLNQTLRGGSPAGINRLFTKQDFDGDLAETRDQVIGLLRAAATLDARLQADAKKGLQLAVIVRNSGAGHELPTGPLDQRHMWLEVEVQDSHGKTVFHSGRFDGETGQVDPQSVMWVKHLYGEDGKRDLRHILFDAASKQFPRHPIPAGASDEVRYPVSLPRDSRPPYRAQARLWYRLAFQEILANIDRQGMGDTTGIVIPPVLMQEIKVQESAATMAANRKGETS